MKTAPKLSALDVAKYFIWKANKEGKNISNKKLQKLLYYAQAWNLVFNDEPLFKEKIEAWIHGPAIREVYNEYKAFSYKPIKVKITESEIQDLQDLQVLEDVWSSYGKLDADYLESLTHSEEPWQFARENLEEDENSENEITLESMKVYYEKRLEEAK